MMSDDDARDAEQLLTVLCASICAVTREQAARGRRDLEHHPEARLMRCLPARPAETVLDVAITWSG